MEGFRDEPDKLCRWKLYKTQTAPSSSGLGQVPLTHQTGVRVPLGSLMPAITPYRKILKQFVISSSKRFDATGAWDYRTDSRDTLEEAKVVADRMASRGYLSLVLDSLQRTSVYRKDPS